MEEWETIEPNMWKHENKGDHIIGVFIKKEPKDEKQSFSARYYLENEQGINLVWGSAVLDQRMEFVNIGEKIKIIYKGKEKNSKNQDVKIYEVQRAKIVQEKPKEYNGVPIKEEVI